MRLPNYFGLLSLLSLLLMTSCEKDGAQLDLSDLSATTTPLSVEFAQEDGDQLELAANLAFSDEAILERVDVPEKGRARKNDSSGCSRRCTPNRMPPRGNQIVFLHCRSRRDPDRISAFFPPAERVSGDGLGNQGAVHISKSGLFLYAVNAGGPYPVGVLHPAQRKAVFAFGG